MRNIYTHIIHCSDSNFGNVKEIRNWHLARGFSDVGYHFVIRQDGEIEIGRMLDKIGAHCRGQNATSIGTCLIGKDDFNEQQFAALQKLHAFLKQLYPTLIAKPHNAFNAHKICPNFDVAKVLHKEK